MPLRKKTFCLPQKNISEIFKAKMRKIKNKIDSLNNYKLEAK